MRSSILLLLLAAPLGAQAADSTYRDHDRAAAAARAAGDWAAYRHHAGEVARLTHGHPTTAVSLARAALKTGDTAAARAHLERFARMGLARDLSGDADFAVLRESPAWADVARAIAANRRPVGAATLVFTLPDSDFLAEDVVYDAPRDRFLVSSVRHRKIVAVTRGGAVSDFVPSRADGLLGALALAADAPRGLLWATSAAVPHALGLLPADSGAADVRAYDLATGRLVRRYALPRSARAPVPGDLAVARDGEVAVSDAVTGAMYVVRPGRDALETLVPAGRLTSPQGPAYDARGRLFVADYALGIARIDRQTGAVTWLAHADDVALSGIDGLTAYRDHLIAVQNGTDPRRVLRLALDAGATRVTEASVLAQDAALMPEPTRGAVVNGELWLAAGPGWDQFDDAGRVREGVRPKAPSVVRVRLR
ncbi:MAG: hypothetical protein ACJ8AO_14595 [Gemmatimonadaceae bacterium]